jgi:hypothetical protein
VVHGGWGTDVCQNYYFSGVAFGARPDVHYLFNVLLILVVSLLLLPSCSLSSLLSSSHSYST